MVKSDSPVLNCFWLPKGYCNTSVSGCNQYTIQYIGRSGSGVYPRQGYFQNVILPSLRNESIPYPTACKYLKKSNDYSIGFREIINDALKCIYDGTQGYVFNIDQLKEILRFVPDVEVQLRDEVYFVTKRK